MLRKTIYLTTLPALLLLCGCMGGTSLVAVDPVPAGTSYQGQPVLGIIRAENRGMYLFGSIPIWSGKPHAPNHRLYTMFHNYLRQGYMDRMLMDEGRRMKAAKVVVTQTAAHSSGWFSLWLVWNKQMRTEGIALGTGSEPEK